MFGKVVDFLKKPTSKDIIVNTLGNYLNVFFTALFVLILVRILTKSQYGVLNVLLGIAYVLANVLDFGTSATIFSYVPALLDQKREHLYRFVKTTFYYQSIFSLIVIGILFLTFPWLDKNFFKTSAPAWELYLTAISVLFFIWQNFITNIFFAAKKFLRANIYNNASNVVKTLILLMLALTNDVTVGSVIFVFGIVGPVIFFILLFIEKKDLIFAVVKAEVRKEEFRFGYTMTYLVANQFWNLGLRMDLFLLSYYRPKSEVGDYALAQKIILTVITTIISITQVLSPQFAKVTTKHEVKHLLKTSMLYLSLPAGLFLFLYFLPINVYYLFFTDKFALTTSIITEMMSLPFILYTYASAPYLFILYTIKKPIYILIANIVFFITITYVCYIIIPVKGVYGPPVAIWISFVLSTLVLMYGFVKEYRKLGT